jgi:hypothetical protein
MDYAVVDYRSVRPGVSKGVEDGRKPPILLYGHFRGGHQQGVTGEGIAGPRDTTGSSLSPLALRQ